MSNKNKLETTTFLVGLKYINDYYTNFNFDVSNTDKIAVWYQVFKDLSKEEFQSLIKGYCLNNVYAPTSPTSLIDYYKKTFSDTYDSGEKAFENALEHVKDIRWELYNIKGNSLLEKAILECKSGFDSLRLDSEQKPFLKKEFVKVYERLVKLEIQKENKILLNSPSLKLLE